MPEVYAVPRNPQTTIINLIRPLAVAVQPTCHVSASIPDPRPSFAVSVRSDGGPMVDQVQTEAHLGVNVWATTELLAYALAAAIESGLLGSVNGVTVLGMSSVSGPTPVAEPNTGQSHIYMTFEAVLAGSTS